MRGEKGSGDARTEGRRERGDERGEMGAAVIVPHNGVFVCSGEGAGGSFGGPAHGALLWEKGASAWGREEEK